MRKKKLISLILLSSVFTINAQNGIWTPATNALWTNASVGIGINTPNNNLDIRSATNSLYTVSSFSNTINGLEAANKGTAISLGYSPTQYFTKIATVYENNNPSYLNPGLAFFTMYNSYLAGSEVERMRISSNGNVGIGTSTPTYKLDVCGTIRAKEIKVDLLGGCDFVFKKDYKLMSLDELEKFVTVKQHLPEIASEKEMIESGLNMKEFQMKLLQKMEEMTLYIIDQNKKNEKQEQEIKILKAEIKKIKSNKR